MIVLYSFDPIKPDFGLFFWTVLTFIVFWTLMAKFAFRPIANALKKRATMIQEALDEAKKARKEMEQLKAENERLLDEARKERAALLKEAKESGEKLIQQAREKAKEEASKILEEAHRQIEKQKEEVLKEVRQQVGTIIIDLVEKILHKELKSEEAHKQLIEERLKRLESNASNFN